MPDNFSTLSCIANQISLHISAALFVAMFCAPSGNNKWGLFIMFIFIPPPSFSFPFPCRTIIVAVDRRIFLSSLPSIWGYFSLLRVYAAICSQLAVSESYFCRHFSSHLSLIRALSHIFVTFLPALRALPSSFVF